MAIGVFVAALPSHAETPEISILAVGIFRAAPVTGSLPPGLGDQTLSGVDRTGLPRLVAATETIPAKLCRSFGVIFDRAAPATAPLTIRVTHPPLRRPDGRAGSVDRFDIPPGAGPHYVGFTFTDPWEMVAGDWEFVILLGDRPLARQHFTVLAAIAAPDSGCASAVARRIAPTAIAG